MALHLGAEMTTWSGNYSSNHGLGEFVEVFRCVSCGVILCHIYKTGTTVKTRREHEYVFRGELDITCKCGAHYKIKQENT